MDNDELNLSVNDITYDIHTENIIFNNQSALSAGVTSINNSLINSVVSTNICDAIYTVNPYPNTIVINDTNQGIVIGDTTNDCKVKVYICEAWQTKNPIELDNGLIVSLEEHLYADNEIKTKIYNKIEELYPELAIKIGMNEDNISLRKKSVTLEINKI